MLGASKILTVSYGTFSCTLEGFDEPFSTMKAIAEYFRDLAAEDRYFGAEPPTPDAAMLHRIAEREIQRRVEAKIQDNGVILRTGEAMATEPALAAPQEQPKLADAAVSADSIAARLLKLRSTAAPMATPEVASEDYHEDQDADDLIGSIAAVTVIADQAEVMLDDLIAAESATAVAAPIPAPVAKPLAARAEVAIAESGWQPVDVVDLDLTDRGSPAVGMVSADQAPADLPAFEMPDFELAADIAEGDFVAEADLPDDFEDETALAEAADFEAAAELAQLDEVQIGDLDQISAKEIALEADDDAMLASLGVSLGALIDPDDQEDLTEAAGLAAPESAIQCDDALDADDMAYDDLDADDQDAAPVAEARHVDFDAAQDDEPNEPGRLQRARARVIKIRRTDAPTEALTLAPTPAAEDQSASLLSPEAEAALQAELAALEAELGPMTATTSVAAPVEAPSLAAISEPEAGSDYEFDLAADLDGEFDDDQSDAALAAAVQAELPPITPARPIRPVRTIHVTATKAPLAADASRTDAQASEIHAEPRKRIEADGADASVTRLMAQTNSVMDGAEIKRRQSAIAHLKAAVVATEADRQMSPVQPKADRIDPYRSDLESVVRPRSSETAHAERPSPLVLVSAQRIDRTPAPLSDAPRIVAPVRPRRISAVSATVAMHADTIFGGQDDDLDDDEDFDAEVALTQNLFSDAESFGDFAERLGASELPELLEAAAVYCAQVLGRPEFSRPLVLSQLASLPEAANFSREDGLRVFGTLMRQGRIAKIKHGQFAVTDRSPLLAEAMRSAG